MDGDTLMNKITYYKKLISMITIVSGAALLLEHLFTWGGFDLLDFQGHEYYGLILILIGFGISSRWKKGDKI